MQPLDLDDAFYDSHSSDNRYSYKSNTSLRLLAREQHGII